MTSMWDIFQRSGLVDSTTLSWRGRERAERAAEKERRRKIERRENTEREKKKNKRRENRKKCKHTQPITC